MSEKILVLHGPNLNLLGVREPSVYGDQTLSQINASLEKIAGNNAVILDIYQSNAESDLIDKVHETLEKNYQFLIINPAALSHTSVALRDAISGVKIPFVEVHLSNIHSREPFRGHSYFSDIAEAVVCGLGDFGYQAALQYAVKHVKRN